MITRHPATTKYVSVGQFYKLQVTQEVLVINFYYKDCTTACSSRLLFSRLGNGSIHSERE
jgi:hypothetical protein